MAKGNRFSCDDKRKVQATLLEELVSAGPTLRIPVSRQRRCNLLYSIIGIRDACTTADVFLKKYRKYIQHRQCIAMQFKSSVPSRSEAAFEHVHGATCIYDAVF